MRGRRREVSSIILVILAATFLLSMPIHYGKSESEAVLYIDPPSIIDESLQPPATFTVYVKVANVTDLWGFEFKVRWNNTLLECIDHELSPPETWTNFFTAKDDVVQDEGYYWASVVALAGEPFSGDCVLASLTFQVIGTGMCPIEFFYDILGDTAGDPIDHTVQNGFFSNQKIVVPTLRVDPAYVEAYPGDTFEVKVNIEDVEDMGGFDFKLLWNATILECIGVNITLPPTWNITEGTALVNANVTDNEIGRYHVSVAYLPPAEPFTGSQTLVTLTFKAWEPGTTLLELEDVVIVDSLENPISVNEEEGTVTVLARPPIIPCRLYVEPESIIAPEMKPSSIFTINITVANVTDLYRYEFKLGFNKELLNAIGIRVNPYQNETNFTPIFLIDNSQGYLWVNVTFNPPATPITTTEPFALITITFQVTGYGSSVLDLYDTELIDKDGQPIPHETSDGYVQIAAPDVAILDVIPDSTKVAKGQTLNVTVIASNEGEVAVSFNVTLYYDEIVIDTIRVYDLPPHESTTLTFQWNTTDVPEGQHTLKAEAEILPYEENVDNNYLVDGTVEVVLPDIAILDVYPSNPSAYPGWVLEVYVVVSNEGESPASFNVTLYYNETKISTLRVVSLPPHQNLTLTFNWDTTGLEHCCNYTLKAEAEILPYEENIENNFFTDGIVKMKIMGDVNGDGTVNLLDLIIAGSSIDATPESPEWNPDADLNQDLKINLLDLLIISANYGASCSQ